MHTMPSHEPFNVLVGGAGLVNFGSTEGPWNHTRRIEKILGPRLRVVGLVDLNVQSAQQRIDSKPASEDEHVRNAWRDTRAFTSVKEAAETLAKGQYPHLAICGLPPYGRGSLSSGKDVDLQISHHFPRATLFVEKPISSDPNIQNVRSLASQIRANGTPLTSCGYMFRYLRAIQRMKDILAEGNLQVMATSTTYYLPYEFAGAAGETNRLAYWDTSRDQGPIVSQATHVADLSRYFGGEVDLSSVNANTTEFDDEPGRLRLMFLDESGIETQNKIPRVTSANWRYESGAVGTLLHAIALHDGDYDTEFTVLADGYRMKLFDPYGIPKLHIRRPGSTKDEITEFPDDDPFESQFAAIIAATDDPSQSERILSSYEDAIKTYEFTWAIRLAGEKGARERRESAQNKVKVNGSA